MKSVSAVRQHPTCQQVCQTDINTLSGSFPRTLFPAPLRSVASLSNHVSLRLSTRAPASVSHYRLPGSMRAHRQTHSRTEFFRYAILILLCVWVLSVCVCHLWRRTSPFLPIRDKSECHSAPCGWMLSWNEPRAHLLYVHFKHITGSKICILRVIIIKHKTDIPLK